MNKIVALKRHSPSPEAALCYARVEEERDSGYTVRRADGTLLPAQRAVGCLLAPENGDEVLLADEGGRAFILSVLTRQADTGRIALPATSAIVGDAIALTAGRSVSMEAPRITFTGIFGEARFDGLALFSRWCDCRIKKITAVAEIWDRVVGRLSERIRDSYRTIENAEQTRAGRIRTVVQERFSVSSKHLALNAEEAVQMDGKKIHIG